MTDRFDATFDTQDLLTAVTTAVFEALPPVVWEAGHLFYADVHVEDRLVRVVVPPALAPRVERLEAWCGTYQERVIRNTMAQPHVFVTDAGLKVDVQAAVDDWFSATWIESYDAPRYAAQPDVAALVARAEAVVAALEAEGR